MHPTRNSLTAPLAALPALLLAAVPLACGGEAAAASRDSAPERQGRPLTEAPLAPRHAELLEIAFGAASAMPLDPHVKSRSRAQEVVFEACFALDQPARGLRYAEQVENWRKGVGIAEFARYCAEHGFAGDLEALLQQAVAIADGVADGVVSDENPGEIGQSWRRERILARVTEARLLLGGGASALAEADINAGEAAAIEARSTPDTDFDARIEALDAVHERAVHDEVLAAIDAVVALHDGNYANPERRARLEERLSVYASRVPAPIHIDALMRLCANAIGHDDAAHGRELLDVADGIMSAASWTAEARVPLLARLAGMRFRAGEEAAGRAGAEAALAAYEAERESIVDVFRAETLRPVAEAFADMGERAAALRVYQRTVEEGALNPNARPRAEDLVDTCVSIACKGVDPDAALMARIRAVRAGLSDPW